MAQWVEDFPNEILLHVFSFLPLKSLITGRTVSQKWRGLIPLSDITPIRRALLDFYLTLINSPIFPQTRPWVLAKLKQFDRQKYIDDLMDQHPYVPEAFRVWILEWPAKAVIGCVWPGLPNVTCIWEGVDNVHRIKGVNWLAPLPPTVSALPFRKRAQAPYFIPALFIFNHHGPITFLMLDERESLRGKVYTWAVGGSSLHDEEVASRRDKVDGDWIGWQKRTWGEIEVAAKGRAQKNIPILQLEDMPREREHVEGELTLLQCPADSWQLRDDPIAKLGLHFSQGYNYYEED